MTTHLTQVSLSVNKGTKGRLNHTALKVTDFSHFFFRIAMTYAIYAIETAFIVFLDHENVGLHILLSTIRSVLYEILSKNVFLLMAAISNVARNDVL